MAEVSQKTKYVKLDDGVSFSLVRTNPKLTTNTKLMYNGKKMYMESYASSELLNRTAYKNVSVRQNSTYNNDIAKFLQGSGSQAYSIYQNFSDAAISDSYDNQFETMYWCGAEYINSSFYDEEIGFVAPLYLREKLPNYFVIFRLDTPSNYNLNIGENGRVLDSTFDFKTDILDKAVLIKTFDLREGSVLGNYIYNYIEQDGFEFDKSMYVNFSNGEVTYFGINKSDGVLEKKVENFENELLRNDNPILQNDKWFTEGFERNGLIFPYIMNIEYLFNDDNFTQNGKESYDFARYIGVYCNNIEFGEFEKINELKTYGCTKDDVIYYFEDINNKLHRYTVTKNEGDSSDSDDNFELNIDGKDSESFDVNLITGFEKDRITAYAEPLGIYEGFINRAQYGFEILKNLEPGDWIGIEYDGSVECYFADNKNINAGVKTDMAIGEYSDFRFSVSDNSTINDIAESLVKSVNSNKKSKFEARCSDNVVAFYAKREGKEYNGSANGGAKIMLEASLLYNKKISLPISKHIEYFDEGVKPLVSNAVIETNDGYDEIIDEKSLFGDYYMDYFCGACNVDIDPINDVYKNVFKIYTEEYLFFDVNRYLKTNNGGGRRIDANIIYINADGKIDPNYRLVIVDDVQDNKRINSGYDVSVSSTYQVEIMDIFKPNHGVLSWFPVKDFDFDLNYSTYGQYTAFFDECNKLSKKIKYNQDYNLLTSASDDGDLSTQDYSTYGIRELAKSPLYDDFDNSLQTEYDYYNEQFQPTLCLLSKTTPFISKWGYYDDQKDSCENPYRLNVSKVFGVSNLSANTYLRNCVVREYTHSMPYYMILKESNSNSSQYSINYLKDYQYIESDEIYNNHYVKKTDNSNLTTYVNTFTYFFDCKDYWINVFMNTEEDMFSYFFSGKKYGKRFDKKYSRIFGGDKFHNPSTLFRGVKFEAVRYYNGVEKRSNEYNNYKFSFVYIPVMLDTMVFNSTVHFVKNDTFKFIVGIVFVNTMLGKYDHNIFKNRVDYFNKGFLYAACNDIIRPEPPKKYNYNLTLNYNNGSGGSDDSDDYEVKNILNVYNDFWDKNYNKSVNEDIFYMWKSDDNKTIFISKIRLIQQKSDIIGKYIITNNNIDDIGKNVGYINTDFDSIYDCKDDSFIISWSKYYENYDTTIYGSNKFSYYGYITCKMGDHIIELKGNRLVEICDIEYEYYDGNLGYVVDVSNLRFKSESIQNILINIGDEDSVVYIKIYNTDSPDGDNNVLKFVNNENDEEKTIRVDIFTGDIIINPKNAQNTIYRENGNNGESIENLLIDIAIKDKFDTNFDSLCLKNYFTVFNQISAYSITNNINNDYNVEYYSTVEDNHYKMRVIEPDCIEIEDKFESTPVMITQNNKMVIGSFDIKDKANIDKIGTKVINRYSGFYNPIFNDILYYGDYTYSKTVGRLKNTTNFELPYSNTNIDYKYNDAYGEFGVIKNMFYHKTNIKRSNNILTSVNPVYPIINEYALDYRDYNIFSSSWDEGYFISQDDINNVSVCEGIGSMKDSLCMFGSKYLNIPDYISIDTFENGKLWDDIIFDNIDISNAEIIFKEINNKTVRYQLFIEKRLKRYLKESLLEVFAKYINKNYSFGNKGTIEDDVDEYVEKNLLKLYKVDKIYMYIKDERMRINDRKIENEYLKYVNKSNDIKIQNGFPVIEVDGGMMMKDSKFIMGKINEFDRQVVYNLKPGYKESFGFSVSFKRK